ncbi:AmmeMemoRadiSam system protein B [Neptuniibacter halophilus]|uniref:AmmeMemoRadiSam system protein B n=1 Tax=Neptuniibacter halophilus TaxID=651666 RepID=UPI0025725027|nr:AmmeMemoRadiSam system protein B [Neptuniibacter halophilus]
MNTRVAAVAGMFYPAEAEVLAAQVDALLHREAEATERPPRGLIVPHAGYIYSGSTAAAAYRLLQGRAEEYARILLLGPGHRVAVRGMAVPAVASFSTPLGDYPLATEALAGLVQSGLVQYNDAAHQLEHSLEVQLPFLQRLGFSLPLLPVVVGQASAAKVAGLITEVCAGDNTLLLISTDLSHFHPYEEARRLDTATTRAIVALHSDLLPQQACGCYALNGLLHWLQQSGGSVELVTQCNSGDCPQVGDKTRVVGYGAYVIYS